MNIRRLFRWLDQLSVDASMERIAMSCREHLQEFSLEYDHKSGFVFVLGGMVGPLAVLRTTQASCSERESNRIVAIAIEGAARVGLAYSFHPQRTVLMSSCEDLIASVLIEGASLEEVSGCVEGFFSCIPKDAEWSSLWFQEIRRAVQQSLSQPKVGRDVPEASLSIEPLYHQDRLLCETLVRTNHPLKLAQQTTANAIVSILSRHIKAAGKRLRSDQIERVEINMLSGLIDSSFREYLASLLVFYPESIPPSSDWSMKQKSEIDTLSQVIQINSMDWDQHWLMHYQTLGRIYATATYKERREWILGRGNLGRMRFFMLERALRNHISIEEFACTYPVSIQLYTTRGGCWKETIEELED